LVAKQLEVCHLGNRISGRCVVVALVSIGGNDIVGMVCGTELGKQGKDEVPPQVPRNHVPIIFCIDDKRSFLWIKI
jgi:hypothetical protein